MAAPAKYASGEILTAAGALLAREGLAGLTVSRVCQELGAPSGSVYHRFGSRAALLASLWLDAVESFQADVLPALDQDDPRAVIADAMAAAFAWVAANPDRARVLLLHHRRDFVAGAWPDGLLARANRQSARLTETLERVAALLPPPRPPDAVLRLGVFGVMQAALRDEIRNRSRPHPAVQPAATRAALAALGL